MIKLFQLVPDLYWVVVYAFMFLVVSTNVMATRAEIDKPTLEYKIKSTYLFNFIKYVEWPERRLNSAPQNSLIIGVVGECRFGNALNFFAGKTVKGKSVVIKKINDMYKMEECHILFFSSSESKNIKRYIRFLKSKATLTIGESTGFINQGGIIEFVINQGVVNFKFNLDIAKKEGFVVSSKLLKIAKEVKGK